MSDRDKKLLVYLGSLLILAAAYFFVGKPYMDKIEELETKKAQLQSELDAKQHAHDMSEEYSRRIDESLAEINKVISKFPADDPQEKSIMFVYDTEQKISIKFPQINFAEVEDSAVGEMNMSEEAGAVTEGQVEAVETEVAQEEANPDAVPIEVIGETEIKGIDGIRSKTAMLGLNFTTNYSSFKEFVQFIRDYDERMVITSMDVLADNSLVSGTLVLAQYALTGPGRTLEEVHTGKEENLGRSNIFGVSGSAVTDADLLDGDGEGESGSDGSSDNGKYDYAIILDASTGNSDAITVGRASGDAEGESYLTSNKNKNVEVYFTVTGESGEYTAKYSIGDKEYEDAPFEKGEKTFIKLKILSNYRTSEDDNVSASIHITNETDLKLVATVLGDDTDNPRVKIVEKNGKIIIN